MFHSALTQAKGLSLPVMAHRAVQASSQCKSEWMDMFPVILGALWTTHFYQMRPALSEAHLWSQIGPCSTWISLKPNAPQTAIDVRLQWLSSVASSLHSYRLCFCYHDNKLVQYLWCYWAPMRLLISVPPQEEQKMFTINVLCHRYDWINNTHDNKRRIA